MNAALTEELHTLHPDSFGWALHCVAGDYSRAEDILQIAYLKLAQGRARFSGASSVKTWWFGVIRYTAMEEARRARFRLSLLDRFMAHLPFQTKPAEPSPAQEMERSEESLLLLAQLQLLPHRQAEVLHLVFYQDVSLAEAAELMGVSLGTARQHYDRGKHRLRANLKATSEPIPL